MSLTREDQLKLEDKTETDLKVLSIVNSQQDAMLARTLEWASINTGSWNASGLASFAHILEDAFKALDANVELIDTNPIVQVDDKGKTVHFQSGPIVRVSARPDASLQLVMTGHYDTVFPEGTFETIQDLGNGRISGPGLADMKGGLVVLREALLAFEQTKLKDQIGYTIIISPDEETGNFASAGYIRQAAAKADIGLTFEPAMENGAMAGGRKGSAIYDIIFHGLASHAGRAPEAGRSAINAAAQFVCAIEELNKSSKEITYNVGAIDGGNAVNIVPDLAIVRLGVRAPDASTAEEAQTKIEALFKKVLMRDGITGELKGGFYRPPKPRNTAQEELFTAVTATAKALDLSLRFQDTGGVCEGNNVFAAGTPNIDTLGVRGGKIHSSDEFVVVESFAERAGLTALILNRIADGRLDAKYIKSLMHRG